jgi:Regulator of chromosome condensation (RCC1) repeat
MRFLNILLILSLFIISCDDDSNNSENCGNNIMQTGETCDGTVFGVATCVTEGFSRGVLTCSDTCIIDTSLCSNDLETCGNSIIEGSESCDGTLLDSASCNSLGFLGGTLSCNNSCDFDTDLCEANPASCGDEKIDLGEQCDGESLNGLTCTDIGYYGGTLSCGDDCMFNIFDCETYGKCGDYALDSGEECDGNKLNSNSCESLGYYGGTLACGSDCSYDISDCENVGKCGDGSIQESEECDEFNLLGKTCISFGYHGGSLSCSNICTFDFSSCDGEGSCGDMVIQDQYEETCDGINLNMESCKTLGYHGGTLFCDPNCKMNISGCIEEGLCGDGTRQTTYGEECDSEDFGGETCQSQGYHDGILSCNSSCEIEITGCLPYGACDDGIFQTNEQCETGDLQGNNCNTLGYYGGILSCNPNDCRYDLIDCKSYGYCGDDLVQSTFGEICEVSSQPTECLDYGFQEDENVACTNCQTNTSSCHIKWKSPGGGIYATCAIKIDGTLYCWGDNNYGALGQGNTTDSSIPVRVEAGSSWTHITSGLLYSLALKSDKTIWAWGYNWYGQLGIGNVESQLSPVKMGSASNWITVSTKNYNTCAINSYGELYCWGSNYRGEAGIGNTSNVKITTPTRVGSESNWILVNTGRTVTCAINSQNALYCWGRNDYGQLGVGNNSQQMSPVQVGLENTWKTVNPGEYHTCAIKLDGTAWCWGKNSDYELGTGDTTYYNYPTQIGNSSNWRDIQAGEDFTCGVQNDDTTWCWGSGDKGRQGDGESSNNLIPTIIPTISWDNIVIGRNSVCGVSIVGRTYCWGDGSSGILGNGTTSSKDVPTRVEY